MVRTRSALILIAALGVWVVCCEQAQAQKGRGSIGRSKNVTPPKLDKGNQSHRKSSNIPFVPPSHQPASMDELAQPPSDGPRRSDQAVQRLVETEQRKLEHRQQVADHLRQVGEQNGNERLFEVADRMEQSALEQFEKRMAKIGVEPPIVDEPSPTDVPMPPDLPGRHPNEPASVLSRPGEEILMPSPSVNDRGASGPGQRLQAAEQSLQSRLTAAEQLRELGERNGDSKLLEASEQLETMALDQYAQQLSEVDRAHDALRLAPSRLP